MAMVVRTNAMAMNANRQLGVNNSNLSKSLEKLSSGYKINRAGDDAAGLAISEKMKAQIKGLDQAASNAQDGISLVQTAEGATTEIHNMLNRMVELATKSANGTIDNTVDRAAIQTEVDSLNKEITRITDSTNFNGIKLLDGSLGGASVTQTAGTAGTTTNLTVSGTTSLAVTGTAGDGSTAATYTIDLAGTALSGAGKIKLTIDGNEVESDDIAASATAANIATAFNGKTFTMDGKTFTATVSDNTKLTFTAGATGAVTGMNTSSTATAASPTTVTTGGTKGTTDIAFSNNPTAGTTVKVGTTTYEFAANGTDTLNDTTATRVVVGANTTASATALKNAIGDTAAVDANGKITITSASATPTEATVTGGGLTLQIGDTADSFNKVSVSVENLSAKGLGLDTLKVNTQEDAGNAIKTIKDAINTVSTNRANLGALQNRMEYSINNLNTTSENMSTANSRIRDTDMASEMTKYTQSNILTQAAQAMLAQANQAPQQILQLLQ